MAMEAGTSKSMHMRLCLCLYVYTCVYVCVCVCPLPASPVEAPPFPSDQDTRTFKQRPVELLLSGCETWSNSLHTFELVSLGVEQG